MRPRQAKYIEEHGLVPYATHQAHLVAACMLTAGPILELGAGLYSTLLLHGFAMAGRTVVTMENNRAWFQKFAWMNTERHRLVFVHRDWLTQVNELPGKFSVVLVDQQPDQVRGATAIALLDRAELIVCHDSRRKRGRGYDKLLEEAKYAVECTDLLPPVLVVSNTVNVRTLPGFLG